MFHISAAFTPLNARPLEPYGAPMPNPLDSVLNLIAATILADKRVYGSEAAVLV